MRPVSGLRFLMSYGMAPGSGGQWLCRWCVTEVGWRFAYRERPHAPGNPVRPVELVKEGPPRSQKAKVRWLDGEYEGLEKWVPKVRLVVPWEEKEELLEDERRMFAALETLGDVYDTTTYRAVATVFFAIPQEAGAEVLLVLSAAERELLSIYASRQPGAPTRECRV